MEIIKTLGFYILLFLPGYIFIEIKDHFLLREKKPQFEKALDILLFSFIIWLFIIYIPFLPFIGKQKNTLIGSIITSISTSGNLDHLKNIIFSNIYLLFNILVYTCILSFLFAIFFGVIRRVPLINGLFTFITKRDWFHSVILKFLYKNISKPLRVETSSNIYLGILPSAPDRTDDNNIVLADVYLLASDKMTKLELSKSLLIPLSEVKSLQVLEDSIITQEERKTLWKRRKNKG